LTKNANREALGAIAKMKFGNFEMNVVTVDPLEELLQISSGMHRLIQYCGVPALGKLGWE
jgi:hypothetical protein